MKKLMWMILAFVVLASVVVAQDDDKKPDAEADRQTIVNLEQGFARAIQLNSSSFFGSIFADEFSGVTWFGEVINKAQQIRYIQTSSVSYDFVHCSDIQIRIYRDMATASSLRTERGNIQGKPLNRQFRVLRVYINTPRGWRVVSQQETQLPSQINH